ncbi:hypothetical protein AMS68_004090 [Peltaster fructicola]|uniref:Uncharacterized protein n=1 Tax=Peltaster fructicola TaxID=286661 RepID=A0A6H0XV09_9PEZI|nr:hypothetical protein AMS68_004090 [Peltaster fructicola]
MSTIKAGPKTWVLRCKIHRTTAILYVETTTTLTTVKDELRKALLETHSTGTIETISGATPIPSSTEGIILGKLVDPTSARRGWERIGDEVDDIDWAFTEKGKGKAAAGKGRTQNDNSKVTVQSVGLVDGSLVGVMFRSSADNKETPIDPSVAKKDVWDIVMPRMDVHDDDEDEAVDVDDGDLSDSEIPIPIHARTTNGHMYNT